MDSLWGLKSRTSPLPFQPPGSACLPWPWLLSRKCITPTSASLISPSSDPDPPASLSCYCCEVSSVVSDSVRPHRRQPTMLPLPWDSPGKNSGVGCHFLLRCMKVKSESEVTQSCLTLSDPMDCSPPGSSVHGSFQATVLEWGAIAFSSLSHIKTPNYIGPSWTIPPLPSSQDL